MAALIVSGLAVLKRYGVGAARYSSVPSASAPDGTELGDVEADKTYLFWCADSKTSEIYFAWTLNLKTPERTASVRALDPNIRLVSGETEGSMREICARFGENALARALESKLGVPIDGYVRSDEGSFKSTVNYMGGFEITVPGQIEYRGPDFTLILVGGKQNLKGDSLFKYLRYFAARGADGRNALARAALEIADGTFSPKRSGEEEKIFSRISNSLKTDLTIVDFSLSREWIEFLTAKGLLAKKIADSP